MKRLLQISTALLLAASLAGARAASEPVDIVRSTTDSVLSRITSDRDNLRADPGKMYTLVSEVIFPHFDFAIMSQWVLGEHWNTADEATREAFIEQFRKLLVRTYATVSVSAAEKPIFGQSSRAIRAPAMEWSSVRPFAMSCRNSAT